MEPPPPSRLRRWALTAAVHLTGIAVTLVALSQTALLLVFSSPLALFDPFEDCALNVLELPEKQVVAGSHHGVTTCDVVDPVTGAVLAVVPLQPSWWPRAVAGALALGALAVLAAAAALRVRHTARPRRYREACALLALALTASAASIPTASWVHAHDERVDESALRAARAVAAAHPPPSPPPTPRALGPATEPSEPAEPGEAAEPGESPTPVADAPAPACRAGDLFLTHVVDGASLGGKRHSVIAATNASTADCTIGGWPRVSVVDDAGRVLDVPVVLVDEDGREPFPDAAQAAPVSWLLPPGARVTSTLHWSIDQSQTETRFLQVRLDGRDVRVLDAPDDSSLTDGDTVRPLKIPEGFPLRVEPWTAKRH